MTELEWVELMADLLTPRLARWDQSIHVETGLKLAYGHEVVRYAEQPEPRAIKFETDLILTEADADGGWIPRVVVESKYRRISTHAAITYSQKAVTHRQVHPYLRYGIMLGARKHHPLPGRLYRHGNGFDFMVSFKGDKPTRLELTRFVALLKDEVVASRCLEGNLYESRKRGRKHYTVLHRRLELK